MPDPKQSLMMEMLYGPEIAAIVYARCQELGNDLINGSKNMYMTPFGLNLDYL